VEIDNSNDVFNRLSNSPYRIDKLNDEGTYKTSNTKLKNDS
jgi:hypothetical protein